MNKKLLFVVLAVALVATCATVSVLSDTWLDSFITLTAQTGSLQSMAIYTDCAATTVATSHDFGVVTQGNTYEWTIYVLNTGSEQMIITYFPTDKTFDGGQSSFTINVNVIEYGVPCQMTDNIPLPPSIVSLPYVLPEKNVAIPEIGFPLMPTKMVKLDIMLTVNRVVVGRSYNIEFEVSGVAGVSSVIVDLQG